MHIFLESIVKIIWGLDPSLITHHKFVGYDFILTQLLIVEEFLYVSSFSEFDYGWGWETPWDYPQIVLR